METNELINLTKLKKLERIPFYFTKLVYFIFLSEIHKIKSIKWFGFKKIDKIRDVGYNKFIYVILGIYSEIHNINIDITKNEISTYL